jgi:hypothetical protein
LFADLRRVFGKVERAFEPLNILPAHLFVCTRAIAEPARVPDSLRL